MTTAMIVEMSREIALRIQFAFVKVDELIFMTIPHLGMITNQKAQEATDDCQRIDC